MLPTHVREKLAANEAALAQVAAEMGVPVQSIPAETAQQWSLVGAAFDTVRYIEGERGGHRVAALINFLRVSSSGSGVHRKPRYDLSHRVALVLPNADAQSTFQTVTHEVPALGPIRAPHFANASRDTERAPTAWLLPPGTPRPALPAPFTLSGCVDGIVYGTCEPDTIDASQVRAALDGLVGASRAPFTKPTPEQVVARAEANKRRARITLAIGCTVAIAFFAIIAWIVVRSL